jgi:hypothetical protein
VRILLCSTSGHATKPGLIEVMVSFRPDEEGGVLDHREVRRRIGVKLQPHPQIVEHIVNAEGLAISVCRWLRYGYGDHE